MLKALVIVLVIACVIAWPVSVAVDNWLWNYETKEGEKENGR